ncbi:hypothetical protein [Neotabrizicola shimadae]|uniref:Uncharacterized protein n=1 Tax=Neotabrizicola shimadae TaxID=2807096 RepID=A0A8G0ZSZ1_9RHOB|nr:hypothetical protein [Neotabrizicola shimadae]QYZ69543.1 hypothetical protein JO391_17760 [Neotabrizicola shimadae]
MRPRSPIPLPDAAPLRDVARSLRFVAESGTRTLRRSLPLDALPDPAARIADGALASVLKLGEEAGKGVSALAHALMDDDAPPDLAAGDATAGAHFAAACYDGLRAALAHLGAESCLVSEAAARAAWADVARMDHAANDCATAARLFDAVLVHRVLRDAIWPEGSALPAPEAGRIAVFAVLLAMLSDAAGFRLLVPAATDLALALRAELAGATDAETIARLFDEFRSHV